MSRLASAISRLRDWLADLLRRRREAPAPPPPAPDEQPPAPPAPEPAPAPELDLSGFRWLPTGGPAGKGLAIMPAGLRGQLKAVAMALPGHWGLVETLRHLGGDAWGSEIPGQEHGVNKRIIAYLRDGRQYSWPIPDCGREVAGVMPS